MRLVKRKKESKLRIYFLVAVVVIAFLLSSVRLMQIQIVQGAEHRENADSSTTSTITVKAPRGEIVDRNGKPLAVNKIGFNVVFDKAFVKDDNENHLIAMLTELMEDNDEEWIDTLPVSDEQPYTFDEKASDDDIAQAKSVLQLNSYATAENCIDELISKYKIYGYDQKMTRIIAGVRFEMQKTAYSLNNRYVYAEDIAASTVAKIKEKSSVFQGIDVVEEQMRDYVSGDIAPHIIGTTGPIYKEEYDELKKKGYKMDDIVGKEGVEKAMENYLRGSDGTRQITQNSDGEIISVTEKKATVPGNTVMLTIDKDFQKKVQKILADHVRSDGNKAGSLVVLDVKTGEILAIATYPTYDINFYKKNYTKLSKDPNKPLLNRALFGEYRPGSAYKTSVAVSSLCEGVIGKYSTVNCTGTYNYFENWGAAKVPGCLNSHGHISVVNALKVSCNIFFYDVGRRLGIKKMNQYSHKMGLGVDTGLEIASSEGALASPARSKQFGSQWQQGDVIQAAIGQSDTAITPLQMASLAMTIANKGVRYETHIIKSIQSYNYEHVVKETEPVVASTIKNKNNAFDIVKEGMMAVASRYPDLAKFSYNVAMKTGTPQTGKSTYNSTFVAFAPADEPEIAVAAVVESGELSRYMLADVIDAYNSGGKTSSQKPQQVNSLLS